MTCFRRPRSVSFFPDDPLAAAPGEALHSSDEGPKSITHIAHSMASWDYLRRSSLPLSTIRRPGPISLCVFDER